MRKNRIYFLCIMFLFISAEKSFSQKRNYKEGFYISLENDTIYGYLKQKHSMYLFFRDADGHKKKFTPSKIKGFDIGGKEYKSCYLKDFELMYFLAVKEKGTISLFQYEDINDHNLNGQYGLIGGIAEGSFRGRVSGYYIKNMNDNTLNSVPSANNLFAKFIKIHFSAINIIVEKVELGEISIDDVEEIVAKYNTDILLE
ncbi:MAG: hypothetical protein K9H64_12080 [Bacteroidales bacterium]|nr:hypothetical protein [Bacteroidales bacterium]MCF8456816.1 hypothetical protein [Bacteroidales bacterium]